MFLYNELLEKVKNLKIGKKETILKDNDFEIYIYRPEKKFKNYDLDKNFQIFLKLSNNREFRPNHLIVMIDLNLRIRSNSETKENLLLLFDNIFYKRDYKKEFDKLNETNFLHYLYNLKIITTIYTLLLIEQDFNYPDGKSKYNPKTLFLHGWIRQFICNGKEIDNLVMSVCKGQPPLAQYTKEDDKNHKKFNINRSPLWYLDK
ncbi:MAG: hypothetical protein PHF26_03375 [Candidatus Gracilibacteria bacterium]|nr:hypothetical protein [Candidatus Gracilibacteria bacterium]